MKSNKQWIHLGLLLLTAFIWGNAFVAQSIGAGYIGPFVFMSLRTWLAMIVLMPLMISVYKKEKPDKAQRETLIKGGLMCGTFLFLGSIFQQIGIAHTTTAKAGFITTLYMVFVPVVSVFLGKKPSMKIWVAVGLGLVGLYLLCMQGTVSVNVGDLWMIAAALSFTGQILMVNYTVDRVHPILLSGMQFISCGILSTIGACFEPFDMQAIHQALPTILYAGIFSSGIGYTLQIIGQQELNPTVASLAMCMESVFSALAGWFWLRQTLSAQELLGCALMFAAILITQIPEKKTAP